MNTAKVCLDCVGSQTHINGCIADRAWGVKLNWVQKRMQMRSMKMQTQARMHCNAFQSNLRGRLVSKEMRKNVVPFEISCRIFRQLPIELYGLGLEGEDRKVI